MFVAHAVLTLALLPGQKVVPVPAVAPPAPPVLILGGMRAVPAQAAFTIGLPGVPTAPGVARPAAGGPPDENLLRAARLATSDAGLLDFFRKRTPPAAPRSRIDDMVKRLSSGEPAQRDTAQAELTAVGQPAVPALRTAANNVDDADGSARARACLGNIEGVPAANLVTHAARLLAQRKPAGAAEALIGYLPFAEDDPTFQEVEHALVAVALRDGKPDPALVQALQDKLPLRRGTAAQVICQAGGAALHGAVRPLLKDPRPSVRLRAALGLVGAYDAEAIPVLIDLLAELQPKLRQQAEEYLTQLAGEWAVAGPKGNDVMSRQLRRDIWAAWWKNTDGERLLDEFKSRATSDDDLLRVTALIAKLGDDKPEARDAAVAELIGLGKSAASLLRRAVNDADPRVSPLAGRCLDAIEKDAPAALPAAAPRLLGLRKPPGTVETLLMYLPFCESADLAEQLTDSLSAVAAPGGKPDEALVKALEGKVATRRALAVLALCRARAVGEFARRPQAAQGPRRDGAGSAPPRGWRRWARDAVPAMIGLLKDLPLALAWEVEDYLGDLAGDRAPLEAVSEDPASRAKAAAAWGRWWGDSHKSVALGAAAGRRESGHYLLVENYNQAFGRGRVLEVDQSGKTLWEVRDLNFPNDAQVLRNGHVLVIEQQSRLSERDRSGKVVGLDRHYPNVFHAERLRDGTTFVACRNQLLLIDAKGNPTMTYNYTSNTILAARRFRDGTMGLLSYGGQYVRIDRSGKEVKNAQLPGWGNVSANGAELLPGDRVVIADGRFNRLVELGLDGKAAWECPITYPLSPTLAPNGHVVVTGMNNTAIYEVDRKGKVVKDWKGFDFRPFRAVRR
ncbi:MAG: HEAT repeat domain-containing protein [Gemmataceae bacterium]